MPGQIVHTEILVDDTEAARSFWGQLFDWQFEAFPPGSEYHMAQLSETSGIAISGMERGRSGTRSYFDVTDIDAGIARVRDLGGEADDKQPVPSMGWFVTCRDPHGNDFGLWQQDANAPKPAQGPAPRANPA